MGSSGKLHKFFRILLTIISLIYHASLAILALASLYLWLKYRLWRLRWRSKRLFIRTARRYIDDERSVEKLLKIYESFVNKNLSISLREMLRNLRTDH